MLHSGQLNGLPRKSWASNVTLCSGRRFKAVPPCDPINQVTRQICVEHLAIPGPESDLISDHLFVLHLLGNCRPMPRPTLQMDGRFAPMRGCFSARLRIGACQPRHPNLKMNESLWRG